MSTVRTQYLMVAAKLPFQKSTTDMSFGPYMDNGYQAAIKHKDGLAVVSDGMNGKYTFIGRIIEKSCEGTIDGPVNCDSAGGMFASPGGKEILAALIVKTFPSLDQLVEAADINTWFFTHYH